MPSRLNPYVNFDGNTREAMEFYKDVFGGELVINTFAEFGNPDPAVADKTMHALLETEHGFTLMASDGPPGTEVKVGDNISISLSGDDAGELHGYWDKLAEGGTVTMPLEVAPWGDAFGQLTDRFGVAWMVNIAGSGAAAAETEDTAVSA